MNTEHEIIRLKGTLQTLICWLSNELGHPNAKTLLACLGPPEDPNCLEGPGRTPEEVAQNARELDAVAPTPADKFALMFGADERKTMLELLDYPNPEGLHPVEARWRDFARDLRERVEKVIGHWRDTDWFREGGIDKEITVGVNEAEAIKLLKYLKP